MNSYLHDKWTSHVPAQEKAPVQASVESEQPGLGGEASLQGKLPELRAWCGATAGVSGQHWAWLTSLPLQTRGRRGLVPRVTLHPASRRGEQPRSREFYVGNVPIIHLLHIITSQ